MAWKSTNVPAESYSSHFLKVAMRNELCSFLQHLLVREDGNTHDMPNCCFGEAGYLTCCKQDVLGEIDFAVCLPGFGSPANLPDRAHKGQGSSAPQASTTMPPPTVDGTMQGLDPTTASEICNSTLFWGTFALATLSVLTVMTVILRGLSNTLYFPSRC
jgi:hypothetical protein